MRLDTLVITVMDTIAPDIVYPNEPFVEINQALGEAIPVLESFVIDNCDLNFSQSLEEEEVSNDGLVQVLIRTISAEDACGNASSFVQTLTIVLAIEGVLTQKRAITRQTPTWRTAVGTQNWVTTATAIAFKTTTAMACATLWVHGCGRGCMQLHQDANIDDGSANFAVVQIR